MKKILYLILLVIVFSCNVTENIDNYSPDYAMDADNAIVDESTAEIALTGVYAAFRGMGMTGMQNIIASQLGLTMVNTYPGFVDEYAVNQILPSTYIINYLYGDCYDIINKANWIIDIVPSVDDSKFSGNRKEEIIGEAKFVRAFAHFTALRFFGQFYDNNSDYGVVINQNPSKEVVFKARSNVKDCYEFILQDLDDAILMCGFRDHFYASSLAAKALKAKVLLYKNDFLEAAEVAKDVIDDNSGDFSLVETFVEIFNQNASSKELLFSTYFGDGLFLFWSGMYEVGKLSPYYSSLVSGTLDHGGISTLNDKIRYEYITLSHNEKLRPEGNNMAVKVYYHLRMAEIYLIYAEAKARLAADESTVDQDALEALNIVRRRSELEDRTPTNRTELLEAIRIEKILELATENGEEWFDLIRYEFNDPNFKVSDHKSTVLNKNMFIMPIPAGAYDSAKGIVLQNPGY